MNWISANTIIGPAAAGQKYFPRGKVEKKLLREIGKGNHILFTAPRRVGKSSVMKYLAKHHGTGYLCCYENISSDATTTDFYMRLFELTLKTINIKSQHVKQFKKWFSTVGIEKIGADGITFKSKDVDYKAHLISLLPKLEESRLNVVLFLDEFPDVVSNINKNEGAKAALDILQTLRSLRHNDKFKNSLTLVLAGSIGLDHVVKSIDRTAVINDLSFQYLASLSKDEALLFIDHLVKGASMKIDTTSKDYLIDKLVNYMPYYIQLIVETCDDLLQEEERSELLREDIDRAWTIVLQESKYFSDWDERLKGYFPTAYPFFVEVLSICADQNSITIQEILDISTKYGFELSYKALIDDVLVKDGYLMQQGTTYQFQSPLLQQWWKNRHPRI